VGGRGRLRRLGAGRRGIGRWGTGGRDRLDVHQRERDLRVGIQPEQPVHRVLVEQRPHPCGQPLGGQHGEQLGDHRPGVEALQPVAELAVLEGQPGEDARHHDGRGTALPAGVRGRRAGAHEIERVRRRVVVVRAGVGPELGAGRAAQHVQLRRRHAAAGRRRPQRPAGRADLHPHLAGHGVEVVPLVAREPVGRAQHVTEEVVGGDPACRRVPLDLGRRGPPVGPAQLLQRRALGERAEALQRGPAGAQVRRTDRLDRCRAHRTGAPATGRPSGRRTSYRSSTVRAAR
jgi:hypothetical protein